MHPLYRRGGFHKAGEGPAFGGLWVLSGSRKEPPAGSDPWLASQIPRRWTGQPLSLPDGRQLPFHRGALWAEKGRCTPGAAPFL